MQLNFVDTSRAKGLFDEIPSVFVEKMSKKYEVAQVAPDAQACK